MKRQKMSLAQNDRKNCQKIFFFFFTCDGFNDVAGEWRRRYNKEFHLLYDDLTLSEKVLRGRFLRHIEGMSDDVVVKTSYTWNTTTAYRCRD